MNQSGGTSVWVMLMDLGLKRRPGFKPMGFSLVSHSHIVGKLMDDS